jgi:ABC-type phosphate/phosphonate transport system substrate-binding protein
MKKKLGLAIALVFVLVLVACAGQQQPASADQNSQAGGQSSSDNQGVPTDQSGQAAGQGTSLDSRLALGILEMEGTDNAITADQAKQLLPLFQQLQSDMSNFGVGNGGPNATPDANATPQAPAASGANVGANLQALDQKIEMILTTDQVQAIEQMTFSQSDIASLMQKYNIQFTPGAGQNGGSYPTQDPSQMATRQAARDARQTQVAANGGTPDTSGTLVPGGYSGTPGVGGFGGRTGFGGGYERLFLDPLITLLQQRAGA